MKKKRSLIWLLGIAIVFVLSSCSGGGGAGGEEPVPPKPEPPVSKKIPISLSCTASTRISDTGYESGDKVGLYVVNYNGNTAGVLQKSGNHADNAAFTYNGSKWTSTNLYWKDDNTPADFYCYFPYNGTSASDVTAYPFSVNEDQSTEQNYKASEFTWGKKSKVNPTESTVSITMKRLFCSIMVQLKAGNGYTETELANAQASVKLNGCQCDATINLRDGTVTANGNRKSITPLKDGSRYKALTVPQSISAEDFITITIDGKSSSISKDFTLESSKKYTVTVEVNKTSEGLDIGLIGWEDDGKDNGGTAE